ncbi:hypothetical protein FRACYDRAFT_269610 [Fragilariopsis cylindrus CCMP1102]|uniref:Uncharacterized protein n=1 Tax=Fragilariopsis cylindrus CCMP1102 TaxID=635003 RepID=A0A1E7F8S8_9STRA|nr:hypothetical protein FRACYDRAFT_269610 [Fragilariopsis cylindrus CCMP1102]|eukprot:OEU14581.1 hypothetical protein FRACYDRAFT_269610 [Fragilariopsis cylindrus CCMP1102]
MRLFIRRMMNFIVCRAVVSASVLLALLANNADSQENESLKLNNANECHPNGGSSSGSSSSSSSSCENGYHCVFNSHSSIGGYCINNDHKSDSTQMDMDMPEGLQSICFICNDDDHFDFDLNQSSSMSKPNDKVGVFTCEELDQHGKSGSIPQTNCGIFQRMIHANNLCGCSCSISSTAIEGKYDDDFIEDIQVLDDHVNPYSSRTDNGNGNDNNNDEDDEVQSLTTTTSSSDSFSKTTSAVAATAVTTIIVATLSILQSFLSSF